MSITPFKMIEDDLDIDAVSAQLLEHVYNLFKDENIVQNEVQKAMLESHLKAMVYRAKTQEPLPEVDPSMFNEISPESIAFAKKVASYLPGIDQENEAYLFSVHVEVAKANDE